MNVQQSIPEEVGAAGQGRRKIIQPWWVRLTHWLTALAIVIMVPSGWQVYNASPLFAWWVFPSSVTLGGWLGGALQWHFAGMWLLFGSFSIYLLVNLLTGRLVRRFGQWRPRSFIVDLVAALTLKLKHADPSRYNAVQKVAYLCAMLDLVILVLSGLALWKPVQLSWLRILMGGYDAARYVHFAAMSFLVGFIVIHLLMVLLVPRSLLLMLRGR
ncbi:cytochrome b/b6 domain-containing protein [Robbsia andropogonis]|uniref:cytochrome b/b6 domain-containing protein n=1 Tax=Robbsia andropogonis TaxID=28092 RepID=UPI000464124D|nr:cytochrome b/b6 domain-containing protein [Robbsia andropogonis]MCP1119934.1 cytochrome b/b6 domain-containing protein [Robbsia andropogonis]MCP1129804.1 cytochrome b/b6 domain-containing protein [Robbsia andropogonis]